MPEPASFPTLQSAQLMPAYWAQVAEAAAPGPDDGRPQEMNKALRRERTGWTVELTGVVPTRRPCFRNQQRWTLVFFEAGWINMNRQEPMEV